MILQLISVVSCKDFSYFSPARNISGSLQYEVFAKLPAFFCYKSSKLVKMFSSHVSYKRISHVDRITAKNCCQWQYHKEELPLLYISFWNLLLIFTDMILDSPVILDIFSKVRQQYSLIIYQTCSRFSSFSLLIVGHFVVGFQMSFHYIWNNTILIHLKFLKIYGNLFESSFPSKKTKLDGHFLKISYCENCQICW